jgi:chromosome segregation ATPase
MDALKQRRVELSEDQDRLQEQSSSAAYRVRELRAGIGGKERQRAAMSGESRGSDRSGMFGAKVPGILADIQKTRFRGRVVGPLGLHLRLTDVIDTSSAETAVERSMGSSLRSFLVTNGEDRAALAAILRRHSAYSEHSITVQAPRPRYNVSRIKDAITVLDLIQFPQGDDDIFNAIIDQQKIDQILVVSNEEECMRRFVVRDARGNENLIPGCRQAVTYNGTVIRYRAGNRSSEIMREPVRHLLVADLTASIKSLDAEISADKEALDFEAKAASRIEAQRKEAASFLDENGRQLQSATKELAGVVRDIRNFEEQLAEAQVNSNVDTGHLEAERKELIQALEDVQAKLEVEKERLHAANAAEKETKAMRSKCEQLKNKIMQKIRDQEREIEQFVEQQELLQRDIEKFENARATQQSECDSLHHSVEAARAQLEKTTETAMAETAALLGDKWDNRPLPVDRKDSRASLEASVSNYLVPCCDDILTSFFFHLSTDRSVEGKSRGRAPPGRAP